MTDKFEPFLDEILIKVCKSLKKKKLPKLTSEDVRFIEDPKKAALLLISKLATESQGPVNQMACAELLGQTLTNLRYHYEREEPWAKRLYEQISKSLDDHATRFSRDCMINIIRAFYDARLEVPDSFKELSMEAMAADDMPQITSPEELAAHGQSMIEEFFEDQTDITSFELSDIIFQSIHALPAAAVASIVDSLIKNQRHVSQDTAILFLLHPDLEVRTLAIEILNELLEKQQLTPDSLGRLITIRQWSPATERPALDNLVASQRKRGIQFAETKLPPTTVRYEASIFDGSGVQMIFIETREGKQYRLGGFLVKHEIGIRDAWMTPASITEKELRATRKQMKQEANLPMFEINEDYVARIVSHYIALNNRNGETPEPHLLEIYEHLAAKEWRAEPTNIDSCLGELIQAISPDGLSSAWTKESLERSGDWPDIEDFTESWFEINQDIDALINRHSSLHKGNQKIRFEDALDELGRIGFETMRHKWVGLFLWMALMTRSQPMPDNPILWKDFATLAYVLQQGWAMQDIPLMDRMIHDSLTISIESMRERGAHLQ